MTALTLSLLRWEKYFPFDWCELFFLIGWNRSPVQRGQAGHGGGLVEPGSGGGQPRRRTRRTRWDHSTVSTTQTCRSGQPSCSSLRRPRDLVVWLSRTKQRRSTTKNFKGKKYLAWRQKYLTWFPVTDCRRAVPAHGSWISRLHSGQSPVSGSAWSVLSRSGRPRRRGSEGGEAEVARRRSQGVGIHQHLENYEMQATKSSAFDLKFLPTQHEKWMVWKRYCQKYYWDIFE